MLAPLLRGTCIGTVIAYSRVSLFVLLRTPISRTNHQYTEELDKYSFIETLKTKYPKVLHSLKFNVWGCRTLSREFLVFAIVLTLSPAGQDNFPLHICAQMWAHSVLNLVPPAPEWRSWEADSKLAQCLGGVASSSGSPKCHLHEFAFGS